MANNSSESGTIRPFLKKTTSDYGTLSGKTDIDRAIKNIRTKIEVLHLDPKEKNKVISKSAKRRFRKKLQLVIKGSSSTSLDLQIKNNNINIRNVDSNEDTIYIKAEAPGIKYSIHNRKSDVGSRVDFKLGNTFGLENKTNSNKEHISAADSVWNLRDRINSNEEQLMRSVHEEHSLADEGLTEHMYSMQNEVKSEHSNINKDIPGLQNLKNPYENVLEGIPMKSVLNVNMPTESSKSIGTKLHQKVFKQQFKPKKHRNKAKANEKYRFSESICEEYTKQSTSTMKDIFESDVKKINFSKNSDYSATLYGISDNAKRYRHLSVYMFKIQFGANKLSNSDIAYLLKVQNSIRIKRVESRMPISDKTSIMIVRIDSNSEEILKQKKFKVSLIRTKVTFRAFNLKLFGEKKQDDLTMIDTNSQEVNDEPFSWLGKWQTFSTVLNKSNSTMETPSSSNQEKLIPQSQNPSEEINYTTAVQRPNKETLHLAKLIDCAQFGKVSRLVRNFIKGDVNDLSERIDLNMSECT